MALFSERFSFHPGVIPSDWPSITEPPGSVTLSFGSVFAGGGQTIDKADELILRVLAESSSPETRLLAINYNHAAYWFLAAPVPGLSQGLARGLAGSPISQWRLLHSVVRRHEFRDVRTALGTVALPVRRQPYRGSAAPARPLADNSQPRMSGHSPRKSGPPERPPSY